MGFAASQNAFFCADRFEQFLAALAYRQNLFSLGCFVHGVIQLGRHHGWLIDALRSCVESEWTLSWWAHGCSAFIVMDGV